MSYPTVAGRAVEGLLYREAQSCLGPKFATSTYKFFLSGTSTPTNVYQNGTLTTPFPITGVVTADSFGRFPPIYLDPSKIYRVQFFNSANVQQWQSDPYTSQIATVGTSSLSAFGFQIAPTGEVTLDAPNSGGTNITLTLKAGVVGSAALQINGTLPGNSALIINSSATTGAQTATFAASNKPGTATSSPAGWLPITCDGVQYYTPIWHGNPFSPYVANPSANGEVIVASSVTFGGNGLTTATGGTATPGNWFSPTTANVGAGYYINITKTGGLSGLAFSAAQGAWTNISAGGITISSNAQATVTGTYQLSTSVTGSPVVAAGTITLSNNNGVQSPTYNGAANLILAGNGTATLNGGAASNWFAPTTPNTGSGFWINITQTGGSSGTTFSAAGGAWTNITNGGLTIGLTGGTGTTNATGTYLIASDAGGVNQLGSGTITLTGGSNVQSPNWSGTTPLVLAGNGSATLNGVATSDWYSPNASNVGSGFWINITRTGGTGGVNFSAAQGSWTNITNSGLTIDITGYTGDVGTVTASGTYQISSSSGGTPVLGSGTISLSLSGLTLVHQYTSGSGTETVPTGASFVVIQVISGGGSGCKTASNSTAASGGGGSFGGIGGNFSPAHRIAVTAGQTFSYTVGAGGLTSSTGTGNPGTASSVTGTVNSGTLSIVASAASACSTNTGTTSPSCAITGTADLTTAYTNVGGAGISSASSGPGGGGSGGSNTSGSAGGNGSGGAGGGSSAAILGPDPVGVNGGAGGAPNTAGNSFGGGGGGGTTSGGAGVGGVVRFYYY